MEKSWLVIIWLGVQPAAAVLMDNETRCRQVEAGAARGEVVIELGGRRERATSAVCLPPVAPGDDEEGAIG